MTSTSVVAAGLAAAVAGLAIAYYKARSTLSDLRKRFGPVLSATEEAKRLKQAAVNAARDIERDAQKSRAVAEKAVDALQGEVASAHALWEKELGSLKAQKSALTNEYQEGRALYDRLKLEVAVLEENLEDMSFGVYKPHFTFQTSDEYKKALE
jgi:uncharacterized protein involved in exopolysaccharide biosynthesis